MTRKRRKKPKKTEKDRKRQQGNAIWERAYVSRVGVRAWNSFSLSLKRFQLVFIQKMKSVLFLLNIASKTTMSALNSMLHFIGFLPGAYDGRQLNVSPFTVRQHKATRFLIAFEAIKHATIALSKDPYVYMYLGDIHFSDGPQLEKTSSCIVTLLCLAWSVIYSTSSVYGDDPTRLTFLRPILWPEQLLLKLQAKQRMKKDDQRHHHRLDLTNVKSIEKSSPENRVQKFALRVNRIVRAGFRLNCVLTLAVQVLVLRSTLDGFRQLSTSGFWFACLPCSLSTMAMSVVVGTSCFVFTLVVFLCSLYFIELVIAERNRQQRIRDSFRKNHFHSYVQNWRILRSLHRLDGVLKERDCYVFFVKTSYSIHLCPLLILCSVLPFLIMFEQNPLFATVGLLTIYWFGLLTFFVTVCISNTALQTQVSSHLPNKSWSCTFSPTSGVSCSSINWSRWCPSTWWAVRPFRSKSRWTTFVFCTRWNASCRSNVLASTCWAIDFFCE